MDYRALPPSLFKICISEWTTMDYRAPPPLPLLKSVLVRGLPWITVHPLPSPFKICISKWSTMDYCAPPPFPFQNL